MVLDSRWASACGFLEACGYTVEDAERRNITMQLDIDSWQERPVQVPKGYELARLAEDEVEEWSACRNAIFSSHGGPGWFREHFMQRYDFEFPGWHVVKHESNIVGIAGAQIVREEYDPAIVRGAMIEYVGVLEQHRRQGLAEALMNACLNYCKRLPAGPTMLLTQPFRVPAVRLYQKLGFAKVAEWRRYTKRL